MTKYCVLDMMKNDKKKKKKIVLLICMFQWKNLRFMNHEDFDLPYWLSSPLQRVYVV